MKDLLIFLVHLLTTIAKLIGPVGAKVINELSNSDADPNALITRARLCPGVTTP